jgi:hypothetical protein
VGGFSIKEGICIQRAQSKQYSRRHITKSPPLSQFFSDFLISSAKIHLQDSTRAISDSGLKVGGRFFHKGVIGHGILAGKYLAEYRDSLK